MPHNFYDWHDRIKAVEREYRAVRSSVTQMRRAIADGIGGLTSAKFGDLITADENLERAYLIRRFPTHLDMAGHPFREDIHAGVALFDPRDDRPV